MMQWGVENISKREKIGALWNGTKGEGQNRNGV